MEAVSILQNLSNRFNDSMDNDFNTAQAIGHLFDGIRALNRLRNFCEKSPSSLCREPLMHGMEAIKDCAGVLGILSEDPEAYQRKKNLAMIKRLGISEEEIMNAIQERVEARNAKNWERADRIRTELEEKGVTLLDGPEWTKWQVRSP
jgi:cysteinyl-tRNA synthetase